MLPHASTLARVTLYPIAVLSLISFLFCILLSVTYIMVNENLVSNIHNVNSFL
jgi:hypothetical protein